MKRERSPDPAAATASRLPTARGLALRLLCDVLERHRTIEEIMPGLGGELARLEVRDRAFSHLLALTTLRRLGAIDHIIGLMLERPLPRPAIAARAALRLGVAQLVYLATPAHAAVDATVDLLGPRDKHRGLVNAVLRRVAREGAGLAELAKPIANAPSWMVARWTETYGSDTTNALLAAHLCEAPLDVSVKPGAPADLAQRLEAEQLPNGSLRRSSVGAVDELPGFAEGWWWVQDMAAAFPALLLGPVADRDVIDLCAAPGGKTAQLCALGARVTALDRSAERLKRLQANLDRLALRAKVVVADAAKWQPETLADALLLDAPCSATGTVRRHPDLPWLRSAADIAKLATVQARLLDAASTMVKPGGLLVYAVCSLEPEEGPAQVRDFLARNSAFERMSIAPGEAGITAEMIDAEGDLRTLPCHWPERGGMDGFFAARLQRRS